MSDQNATSYTPVGKTPQIPAAPASEAAYVGALLAGRIAPGAFFLEPEEFRTMACQIAYEVGYERSNAQLPLDIPLVAAALEKRSELASVGGEAGLTRLLEQGQNLSEQAIDEHANLIRQKAVHARILAAAVKATETAASDPQKALKVFEEEAEVCRKRLYSNAALHTSTDADLDAILGSIEWLWQGWILRGYVTAIVAPQEQGKSNVSLDLCGRLLTGQPWPDGTPTGISSDCHLLWVDTEMALGAMVQRLNDWHLPRGRFILPENPTKLLQLDNDADWRWIEAVVAQYRPPLIVIDALSGAHRSEEKDNDAMKVLLQKLSDLAQRYKMAVVIIHHMRKASVGETDWPISLDRVRGASAITQFCRSIIALGTPDKTQPDLRRFESIKSNFAQKPEALGYQITEKGLAWGAAPDAPKASNAGEEARAFLISFLAKGACPSSDVFQAGEAEGLAGSTIKRASKDLGIKATKERGRDGRWFWALPTKLAPAPEYQAEENKEDQEN